MRALNSLRGGGRTSQERSKKKKGKKGITYTYTKRIHRKTVQYKKKKKGDAISQRRRNRIKTQVGTLPQFGEAAPKEEPRHTLKARSRESRRKRRYL